jgi:hypothetical protein
MKHNEIGSWKNSVGLLLFIGLSVTTAILAPWLIIQGRVGEGLGILGISFLLVTLLPSGWIKPRDSARVLATIVLVLAFAATIRLVPWISL